MYRIHLFPLLLVACIETPLEPIERGPRRGVPADEESPVHVDRILQVQQPLVDVLFVVDNSCSMAEEQLLLSDNFPGFMEYFEGSGLDYHIGVVSTDMADPNHRGQLRRGGSTRFIEQSTENPIEVFNWMANMGTSGSFEEKGRAAAYSMVELRSEAPRNVGFVREEAALHLVFISDEEDQSGSDPVAVGEFRAWMANKKSSPDLVTAHAIVGIPGRTCSAIDTAGALYVDYANRTGGQVFDLCEPDWGPLLDALGLQTSGLKREYFLSRIPVTNPWSLEVAVVSEQDGSSVRVEFETCPAGDEPPTCRVAYNAGKNSIVFLDFLPDPFAEILVRYNQRDGYIAAGSR